VARQKYNQYHSLQKTAAAAAEAADTTFLAQLKTGHCHKTVAYHNTDPAIDPICTKHYLTTYTLEHWLQKSPAIFCQPHTPNYHHQQHHYYYYSTTTVIQINWQLTDPSIPINIFAACLLFRLWCPILPHSCCCCCCYYYCFSFVYFLQSTRPSCQSPNSSYCKLLQLSTKNTVHKERNPNCKKTISVYSVVRM